MAQNLTQALPLFNVTSLEEPQGFRVWASTILFLALSLPFAGWCLNDYRAFLALGPGGPPHSFLGWATVTFTVRPFALSYEQRLKIKDYPSQGTSDLVQSLPRRRGPRARTGGIAPHRQLSQHAPEAMRSVSFRKTKSNSGRLTVSKRASKASSQKPYSRTSRCWKRASHSSNEGTQHCSCAKKCSIAVG
jgi:hypothetical protein